MEKRLWYCDLESCKKEVVEEDLVHINIVAAKRGFSRQELKVDVCQECALKVGILKLTEEDKKAQLTDVDALYDIVANIICDHMNP